MLSKAKKEMKELLSKINENTSVNIKSSVKVLIFHGNKGVVALPRFFCFRNLSGYNLKWESVWKVKLTEKEKATLSIVTGFFSNAAWFTIIITCTKQSRIFCIQYRSF